MSTSAGGPGQPAEGAGHSGVGDRVDEPRSAFPLPEPPSAATSIHPDAARRSSAGYLPLAVRARAARIALLVVAVVDALAALTGVFQLLLLGWIETGDYSESTVTASDTAYAAVGGVQVLATITTIVLFLRWFHRAYKNLPALSGGTPRYGSGWAIGGWFVPILNVFRPKQVANDLWRGSDPDLAPDAIPNWSGGRLPALYAIWWGGWIVSSFLANASFRLTLRAETLPEIVTSTQVTLAADLLGVPLALVAAAVVARTTRRMEERAARVLSDGSVGGGVAH